MPGGDKIVQWIWVVLAIALPCGIPAYAQTPPEQVEAYVLVIKAEQAERDGDLQGAQTLYNEALTLYRQVGRDYPKWRPDLVQYRIAHCMNQAERLKGELKKANEPEDPSAVAVSNKEVADNVSEGHAALLAKNEALSARIQELETARTNDQEKIRNLEKVAEDTSVSASNDAELTKFREANEALEEENRQLEKSIRDLKAESERRTSGHALEKQQYEESLDKVEQVVATLRTENENLEIKISELEEMIIPEEQRLAAQVEIEKITDENNALKQASVGQELAIKQLRDQLEEVERNKSGTRKELEAERERLIQEVAALKETVDLNMSEVLKARELRSTIKALEKQIIPDKQRQAEKAEREKLIEENKSQRKTISELTDQIKYIREQLADSERKKDASEKAFASDKSSLEKEITELKARAEASQTELRTLKEFKSSVVSLEKDKANLTERVKELQSGIDGERARMENEIRRLTSQNTVLVDEVQEFRDRLDKADRRMRDYERKNAGIPQP